MLTILGVIMFLRTGWVVGQAGLLGAILIMLISFTITTCTALAISSITTNIRIGAGGAYAVLSQSLGLEVGGAVGIPGYFAQAFAVTMYIFGFREGWMYLFPNHPSLLIDLGVFVVLYVIAYISADFAIKTQYLIMAVIAGSLVSVGLAAGTGSMQFGLSEVQLWGDFAMSAESGNGGDFWGVFAVFFPAVTGIMAGANMSGDLKEPKRSIPSGTLWAIGVSFVIYVLLAIWLSLSASTEELINNYTVMMDKAYWPKLVLAGLLGATFSSALASLVGSARILQAMAEHKIMPENKWLAELSENAEPRHAMIVTGGIILLGILLRDLNAIAPLITMFFLVTYSMICAAVLIEQSLDMVSFRPLFRIPIWVSLFGLIGTLIAMFIVNPIFSFIALSVTVGFYIFLANCQLDVPFEDVRSGLFEAIAQWGAEKVHKLPDMQERAWKPNLLVPLGYDWELPGSFEFLKSLTYPNGYLKLVGFTREWDSSNEDNRIRTLSNRFREDGVFTEMAMIELDNYLGAVERSLVLSGGFFGPNIIFLELTDDQELDDEYKEILNKARHFSLGVYLLCDSPGWTGENGDTINLWISDMGPEWDPQDLPVSLDLILLTGYLLRENWDAELRVVCGIRDESHIDPGRRFLRNYLDQARLPNVGRHLVPGELNEAIDKSPDADLNIMGMPEVVADFQFMRTMTDKTDSPCLFVKGSGNENALA